MKRIVTDYGVVKVLEEEGLGTRATIASALRYRSNTERAQKIRQRALQLGGVVMKTECKKAK